MNNIRDARVEDADAIRNLLEQLGYSNTVAFIENKLTIMLSDTTYKVIVYEANDKVAGFISVHFYEQIAYEGKFATIGFFVVDSTLRSRGIGKALEEYCTRLATDRGCAIMELYSNEKRVDAHRFYERQGYKSYEKYFMKEVG